MGTEYFARSFVLHYPGIRYTYFSETYRHKLAARLQVKLPGSPAEAEGKQNLRNRLPALAGKSVRGAIHHGSSQAILPLLFLQCYLRNKYIV